MALNKRNLALFASVPTGVANKSINFYKYAIADALAVILAAGYFNDVRDKLHVNDVIDIVASADGAADMVSVKVTAVPAAGSDVTVAADIAGEGAASRTVVPTADGTGTGQILASDNFIALASAGANDIATLPAIATVPLGKRFIGKNGATACELRTPASSTTKINNGQADSNEALVAANVSFFIEKTAADNWAFVTYVGGAVACPTPDA